MQVLFVASVRSGDPCIDPAAVRMVARASGNAAGDGRSTKDERPPIGNIPRSEAKCQQIVVIPSVANNLRKLASLCREVADRPDLLPLFIAPIMRAPSTLFGLADAKQKRFAARESAPLPILLRASGHAPPKWRPFWNGVWVPSFLIFRCEVGILSAKVDYLVAASEGIGIRRGGATHNHGMVERVVFIKRGFEKLIHLVSYMPKDVVRGLRMRFDRTAERGESGSLIQRDDAKANGASSAYCGKQVHVNGRLAPI